MNNSKNRHDGGAYRRYQVMVAAHGKDGKDRSRSRKRRKRK